MKFLPINNVAKWNVERFTGGFPKAIEPNFQKISF